MGVIRAQVSPISLCQLTAVGPVHWLAVLSEAHQLGWLEHSQNSSFSSVLECLLVTTLWLQNFSPNPIFHSFVVPFISYVIPFTLTFTWLIPSEWTSFTWCIFQLLSFFSQYFVFIGGTKMSVTTLCSQHNLPVFVLLVCHYQHEHKDSPACTVREIGFTHYPTFFSCYMPLIVGEALFHPYSSFFLCFNIICYVWTLESSFIEFSF